MELSPQLYHLFVRPRWVTKLYVSKIIGPRFDFTHKNVLDFGSGIGSSSWLFNPVNYMGIEPDPRRVAYARRMYPGYQFHVLNENRLPVADQSMDYILIIAVLHHIPLAELPAYLDEFRRVLTPGGKILVMEPCFFHNSRFNNLFMSFFDKGKYIQNEDGYLNLFGSHRYQVEKLHQFKKLFLYNELFFSAVPQ